MPRDSGSPGRNCPRCPRLVAFRKSWRAREPEWFNAPVASFGPIDARLLIVGLAPGLRGANRTGRPFTGDYAGDLLYGTLREFGFATGHTGPRPTTGLSLSIAASPTRCAACRRRTSRRRRRSPPAGSSSRRPSPTCRSSRPSSRSAGSRTTAPSGPVAQDFGGAVQPRRPSQDRRSDVVRQLSLLALQHEHGRAHAADVPYVFASVRRTFGQSS